MPDYRYPQFCPTARAVEILGERWTILIARELLCGPQRFTDLTRRLPGISSSLLSERLARLEERALVARRDTPPPAPATLYELTALGESLRPVVFELMRFGVRFTQPPLPGDHLEPDWLRLALAAFARRDAVPERRYALLIRNGDADLPVYVCGGRNGTAVRDGSGEAETRLRVEAMALLGLATGVLPPQVAIAAEQLEVEGDAAALDDFPALFDLASLIARPDDSQPSG